MGPAQPAGEATYIFCFTKNEHLCMKKGYSPGDAVPNAYSARTLNHSKDVPLCAQICG